MIKVLFYETEAGETPVETFIQSLPVKHGAKVYWEIELLKEHVRNLKEPYAKQIRGERYHRVSGSSGYSLQAIFPVYCIIFQQAELLFSCMDSLRKAKRRRRRNWRLPVPEWQTFKGGTLYEKLG